MDEPDHPEGVLCVQTRPSLLIWILFSDGQCFATRARATGLVPLIDDVLVNIAKLRTFSDIARVKKRANPTEAAAASEQDAQQRTLAFGTVRQLLASLWNFLIAPIEHMLELSHTRELVLVPQGVLFRVPFAAMRQPISGRYLIEMCAISVAPSVAVMQACTARRRELDSAACAPATAMLVACGDDIAPHRETEEVTARLSAVGFNCTNIMNAGTPFHIYFFLI